MALVIERNQEVSQTHNFGINQVRSSSQDQPTLAPSMGNEIQYKANLGLQHLARPPKTPPQEMSSSTRVIDSDHDKLLQKIKASRAPLSEASKNNLIADIKCRLNEAVSNSDDLPLVQRALNIVMIARDNGVFEGMDTQEIRVKLIRIQDNFRMQGLDAKVERVKSLIASLS